MRKAIFIKHDHVFRTFELLIKSNDYKSLDLLQDLADINPLYIQDIINTHVYHSCYDYSTIAEFNSAKQNRIKLNTIIELNKFDKFYLS